MKKLYVIRKYIFAEDISEAIKLEKKSAIHEVYLEEGAIKDLLFTLSGKDPAKAGFTEENNKSKN